MCPFVVQRLEMQTIGRQLSFYGPRKQMPFVGNKKQMPFKEAPTMHFIHIHIWIMFKIPHKVLRSLPFLLPTILNQHMFPFNINDIEETGFEPRTLVA